MAVESDLAGKVRAAVADAGAIREVRMFGGIGFMLSGNLLAAASPRGLLLRVGPKQYPRALAWSGARPMVMRGKAMTGYVHVDPNGLDARALRSRIAVAVEFVASLPAKTAAHRKKTKSKK